MSDKVKQKSKRANPPSGGTADTSGNQAENLQARKKQAEEVNALELKILAQENRELAMVDDMLFLLTGNKRRIAEKYLDTEIRRILKKFGVRIVLQALRAGFTTYAEPTDVLSKLGGICACIADPETAKRTKLLNYMNKKFWNLNRSEASAIIRLGYSNFGDGFYKWAYQFCSLNRASWYRVNAIFADAATKE